MKRQILCAVSKIQVFEADSIDDNLIQLVATGGLTPIILRLGVFRMTPSSSFFQTTPTPWRDRSIASPPVLPFFHQSSTCPPCSHRPPPSPLATLSDHGRRSDQAVRGASRRIPSRPGAGARGRWRPRPNRRMMDIWRVLTGLKIL